jgi:hypothetical protein
MLFATYGAPSPPRGKNPLVIILGVCGGCVLLVIIGVVVMSVIAAKTFKNVFGGAVEMTKTMPAFLSDLKTHNYKGAANLVDPSAQGRLTEAKIKSIEDNVEKKLGKLQSYPQSPGGQTVNKVAAPGESSANPSIVEYVYTYPLTYQKGTATATFKFLFDASGAKTGDMSKMKLSGKVTDFKLQQDSDGQ